MPRVVATPIVPARSTANSWTVTPVVVSVTGATEAIVPNGDEGSVAIVVIFVIAALITPRILFS